MSHDPLIGALLSDRFRIARKLDKESANELYEAEDIGQRRRVLVKFVYGGYLNTQRAEARFREEMKLVAALESEHVARVLDLGVTEGGSPFLVSESLRGLDLKELLAREGRLSVARAVRLMIQTLRGLGEAHGKGLLHFNLKPENLFVSEGAGGEVCKILDFGFAKVRVSRFWRHLEAEMRSVVYMAPERLEEGANADQRADLYSVGAVLYECLTGKPPHPSQEETALIQQILREKPVQLELLRPGLPPGLSDVVHRALAASPARRFASAEEFAQALQPFSRVKAEGAAPAPAAVAKAGKAKAGTVKAAKGKAFSWSSVLGGVAALGLLSYYYLTKEPDVTAELPPASSAPPKFQLAAPSQVAAPPIAASAAAPPLAPSQVAAPSATAPVAAAPSATPAAAGPSASADVPSPAASGSAGSEQSLLCYLNRVSGVVSTRGPGCRQPVFAKPNMKMRARFPKWIPPYCSELAVFHCETASAPAPSPAPSPEPEGG